MKDFDIAKYLREHQLGSYAILNPYLDLKPLKEEETEEELATEIPYEGPEDKLTGLGDGDSFEQDETVSEANGSIENRMYELVNRQHLQELQKIAQMILDDLTDDGFEAEDVEKFLNLQIKAATVPYAQNPMVRSFDQEMEEEWYPHDEAELEKGRAKIIKKK
jgi:DNA-directed RNA polymerase specialized sigma54-like protein